MKITPIVVSLLLLACTASKTNKSSEKIPVVFDSDTNNELDDQHALAYLLFNGNSFRLAGVTVNATRSGGRIELQYAEAERVIRLCGFGEELPLHKGANSSFDSISHHTDSAFFDGAAAVNFIVDEARKPSEQKLVVIAVGKLTNLALALKKEPSIASTIRLVWLGSNYPEPGEYNQDNDTASVNYVLGTKVEFEIVTVRYGSPTVRMSFDLPRRKSARTCRAKVLTLLLLSPEDTAGVLLRLVITPSIFLSTSITTERPHRVPYLTWWR